MGAFGVVRARLTFLAVAALLGCALVALADEPRRLDMSRLIDAGVEPPPNLGDIPVTKTPADPPALVEQSQWVFDLRWDRGDVWLLATRPLELAQPQATPRVMGRFALELFEGPALIERVRFDFPLLGPPEADGSISITKKLKTRIGVVFPATRRGTRLELLDRATGKRWSMPWPTSAGAARGTGLEAGTTGDAGG